MVKSDNFFNNYFIEIKDCIDDINNNNFLEIYNLIISAKKENKKIIFFGNGGSSSICDHMTVDYINTTGIRAVNFNSPAIITCFSNDYGYKNWVSKSLDHYADCGDIVFLISSSGQSENMLIGASNAKRMGLNIITLTGFSPENPLRKLGDINLWANSEKYNIIEMTHHIWLLAILDYINECNKGL